jgi:tRNA (guanine9-N1)-methyltransferase
MSERSPSPSAAQRFVDLVEEGVTCDPIDDARSQQAASAPLSKNAQKKARKAAFHAERKLERRAREKEAKKEKKRKRAERIAAGEEVSDDGGGTRKRTKATNAESNITPFDARVVIDLGFDDKMSEKVRTTLMYWYYHVFYDILEIIGNKLACLPACIHL